MVTSIKRYARLWWKTFTTTVHSAIQPAWVADIQVANTPEGLALLEKYDGQVKRIELTDSNGETIKLRSRIIVHRSDGESKMIELHDES